MRYVTLALAAALLSTPSANAVLIKTEFLGSVPRFEPTGGRFDPNHVVTGYYQYDTDEGVRGQSSPTGWETLDFAGGATFFSATRWDGVIVTGDAFGIRWGNDIPPGTVACAPFVDAYDLFWLRSDSLWFNVFDCAAEMFAPSVTELAQTNVAFAMDEESIQFEEAFIGPLAGFRIWTLTPIQVGEPETLALVLLGLAGLTFRRRFSSR